MDNASPEYARQLATRLGELVKKFKEAGLSADEVALVLQQRAKARGMTVVIGVQKIGPITALDMHLDPAEVQVLLGDAVTTEPANECPGPHLACPACHEPQAMCLRPDLLAKVGRTADTIPTQGACPSCGSFLVMVKSTDPWTFRLMSEDEVFALSDDERNALLRGRRRAEQRRNGGGEPC